MLTMLYKIRVESSKDGEPWAEVSWGALITAPTTPLVLFFRPLPEDAVAAFERFDVDTPGNFSTEPIDGVVFRFTAPRVDSFTAVEEWLQHHQIDMDAIAHIGDASIDLQLRVPGQAAPRLSLSWNFLGRYNSKQIGQYLAGRDFGDRLREGENAYIRDIIDINA